MKQYTTIDGDVLDAILVKHYGNSDALEQVLRLNPGLSSLPVILPRGIIVKLPSIKPVATHQTVRLWD